MAEDVQVQVELVTLTYQGGKADEAALYLEDYAESLAGLKHLTQTLTAIVLQNYPNTAKYRPDQMFRIEVRTEKAGSWELEIAIVASGVTSFVGAAVYDALKEAGWDLPRLIRWFGQMCRGHIDVKQDTRDVDAIVAGLQRLAKEAGLQFDPPVVEPDEKQLSFLPAVESEGDDDEPEDDTSRPPLRRGRSIVDAVDHGLKSLSKPIGRCCFELKVTSSIAGELLRIDAKDKSVIDEPLVLLPTERDWKPAKIKFVRINRKTGRALMYFSDDPAGEENTFYSIIVDPCVRESSNVYTEAFSKDDALYVYLRHAPPERGRIRTMWEITYEKPEDDLLSNLLQ